MLITLMFFIRTADGEKIFKQKHHQLWTVQELCSLLKSIIDQGYNVDGNCNENVPPFTPGFS